MAQSTELENERISALLSQSFVIVQLEGIWEAEQSIWNKSNKLKEWVNVSIQLKIIIASDFHKIKISFLWCALDNFLK